MKQTIQRIIDYTVAISEPERIILFGSMSENRDNNFSDLDLLVITVDRYVNQQLKDSITTYSNELSLKADVFVYSKFDIEKEHQRPNSFITTIVKTGKIVYENKT